MRNHDVAELLDRMAQLSEAAGEDRFKVIAYRRAATSVRNLERGRRGRLEAGASSRRSSTSARR